MNITLKCILDDTELELTDMNAEKGFFECPLCGKKYIINFRDAILILEKCTELNIKEE